MPPDRIPFAQLLRGVAALSVVGFHYFGVFWIAPDAVARLLNVPPFGPPVSLGPWAVLFERGRWFSAGDFGVSLFFLISGFVIPFSFANRGRLGFVLSRVCRLWPTYAVGVSTTIMALWAVGTVFGQPWAHSRSDVLWQYALGWRDLAGAPSFDGIVWTLEVEIRFYLLCVLLASVLRDGKVAPVVFAAAVLVGLTAAVDRWGATWPLGSGLSANVAYACGLDGQLLTFMLVGVWFHLHLRGRLTTGTLLGLTAATFAAVVWLWRPGPLRVEFGPGVPAYGAALLVFALGYRWRSRIREWEPLATVARISYPLYVVHAVPGYVIMRLVVGLGWPRTAAIGSALACALLSAFLLHLLIERPTHALGRKLGRVLAPDASAD